MRHEQEAEREPVVGRIATRLVVARNRADLEAVPGGDRTAVELEEPEPQPSPPERVAREVAVERRVVEVRPLGPPASMVEREQRVQVAVERRLADEPDRDITLAYECLLASAELLSEVCAAPGDVLLPAGWEVEGRARFAPPRAAADELTPALVAGQLLAEEHVPVELAERRTKRGSGRPAAPSCVHGAELVAGPVTEEADDAWQSAAPRVEREDQHQGAVTSAPRMEQQLSIAPEMLPPEPTPERGREDAARALRKGVPLVVEHAEPVHAFAAGYNFRRPRRFMSEVNAHQSLSKRVTRPLARLVGTPAALGFMLVLRLTSRKAGVALMYHSVDRRAGDPMRELVPPHEAGLFERQVRHVARHYDVVAADRLLDAVRSRRRGQRFPAAITFDDDLACHATIAAPVLRELGVSGTFFLSGASLDHPFSFHFERLQRAYDAGRPDLSALVTGSAGAATPTSLHALGTAMVEMAPEDRDGATERLLAATGPDPEGAGIRRSQVRSLVEAGMTVGFHTLRHDPLTGLTDAQLADAMERGRRELAEAAGAPVDVIGYPHGRADERVAAAAGAAGFRIGYSTRRAPVTPRSNPLLLGRFGPSLRSVGALALELAFTLVKPETGQSSPAPEHAGS